MASELKFLVPWGHIAAKAWGSPKGHPVLCLHGWLDNANTFDRLIPLLPKGCYYIAIDLGGHGLSSHRPVGFPYHFLDYVSEAYRVVKAMKWDRFTLMGHSLGGAVAGMFSCLFPEYVHKLVLLESLGFYPIPKKWEELLQARRKTIRGVLNIEANQTPKVRSPEEALRRLLEANVNLTEESGKILLQRGTSEVAGGLVYNRDLRVLQNNYLSDSMDQSLAMLRKIQADVLLVIAQDGMFARNRIRHALKQFQEAYKFHLKERFEYAEVPGNHFVHLNEAEVVAGIISKFLNKDQSPRANL